MSCNSKTTIDANFTSVAGVIAAIELATPLAYEYPESLTSALYEMNDASVVIPSIRYGVNALTDSVNTVLYPELIGTHLPGMESNYPALVDRLNGTITGITPGRISYTELADFLEYASYPSVNYFNDRVNLVPNEVATELDYYYQEKMSGSAVSLCSLLSNPFENVGALLDMIEGLTSGALNYLPSSASRIKAFAETMKSLVENLFEGLKNIVQNVGDLAAQHHG